MTNEEAKVFMLQLNTDKRLNPSEHEALRVSIKALEQEPILDKIMEEIEQVKSIMNEEIINNNRRDLINFVNGLNQSLVIIERYKTESGVGYDKRRT